MYWLTDSTLIKADTVKLEISYWNHNSNDSLTYKTDTLTFAMRNLASEKKQLEKEAKEREKNLKELSKLQEKLDKQRLEGKDTTDLSVEIEGLRDMLKVKSPTLKLETNKGQVEITDSLWIKSDSPIGFIDMNGIHLEKMNSDSTWTTIDLPQLVPCNQWNLFRYVAPMKLEQNTDYRFTIDAQAVSSIYNIPCDTIKETFKVKSEEEYANLHVNCIGFQGKAFAQLLNKNGKVLRKVDIKDGYADFYDLLPDTYFIMMVLDANENGVWDTGNYSQHLQPEEVFYFHNPIKLKKFSDITLTWNVYDVPVDKQKPEAIRKFKPEERNTKLKKNEKQQNNEEDEEDEFNSSGFINNSSYSGNKYDDVKRGAIR